MRLGIIIIIMIASARASLSVCRGIIFLRSPDQAPYGLNRRPYGLNGVRQKGGLPPCLFKIVCVTSPFGNRCRFVFVTSLTTEHFNQFLLPDSSSDNADVAPILTGLNENPHNKHYIAANTDNLPLKLLYICFVDVLRQATAYCALHCSLAKQA